MIPNTQFSLAIFGETIRAVISRDADLQENRKFA